MLDEFDDFDETEVGAKTSDVCPSCGAILGAGEAVTEGCNDPMGCGLLLEDEEYFDEEEDEELQELNFDE